MILGFKTTFPWGGPTNFERKIWAGEKTHTIRVDAHDRWQQGILIQFATGARTKKYHCFHEGFCNGTQEIRIESVIAGSVYVDGRQLTWEEISDLAHNDGFDNPVDFFRWFPKEFAGKIIHWTNKRY